MCTSRNMAQCAGHTEGIAPEFIVVQSTLRLIGVKVWSRSPKLRDRRHPPVCRERMCGPLGQTEQGSPGD